MIFIVTRFTLFMFIGLISGDVNNRVLPSYNTACDEMFCFYVMERRMRECVFFSPVWFWGKRYMSLKSMTKSWEPAADNEFWSETSHFKSKH